MSRPVKYESRAAKPVAVSLRLNRAIAELVHDLGNALPGATTTERLQGLLTRALLRERDEAAIGTRGCMLRALPDGGFELVSRVEDARGLLLLSAAGQWLEEQFQLQLGKVK